MPRRRRPTTNPDLADVGRALAAAADDRPVELSDHHRAILANATMSATLFEIGSRIPRSRLAANTKLSAIAASWYDNYRVALADTATLRAVEDAVKADDVTAALRAVVENDGRLSATEQHALKGMLEGDTANVANVSDVPPPSHPAYIQSIAVEGFRGIGPPSEITMADGADGPGLTLVYGANGSGKSSFVEALDVLLYGNTGRFETNDPEWSRAWINVHALDGGSVEATFTVPGQEPIGPLRRSWTSARVSARTSDEASSDHNPDDAMRALGWLQKRDEFRPILGYAELGPLFEEDVSRDSETAFARQIRLRTGIDDELTVHQWKAAGSQTDEIQPFVRELSAWHTVATISSGRYRAGSQNGINASDISWLRKIFKGGRKGGPLLPPTQWDWQRLGPVTGLSSQLQEPVRHLLLLNRDSAPPDIQQSSSWLSYRNRTDYLTSRATAYYEMIVYAIVNARLQSFVTRVSKNWSRIRPDSTSTVEFRGIALQPSSVSHSRAARVVLDLAIDEVDGVERGVLSQGELHSLALSIFLPTMTRPESPFGFAVIDDPVQAMDKHAVEGLAKVLLDAAKELQVIVFTHDERLIRAVKLLDFDDRTRNINVTRSAGSVVHCEVADDPAQRALKRARIQAALPVDEDSWTTVAFHCRQAVDYACKAAGRRRLRAARMSSADIQDALDAPQQHERHATRMFMAIAIWGQAGRWQDVQRHVSRTEEGRWGKWVHELIDRLNVLVHDEDEQKVEDARAAYGENLEDLISESAQLVQKIGENCV